jgi:CRP-like cAMP-binding protein
MNKIIDFMKQIPIFQGWTHTSILKFSYYLEKEKLIRNQRLFKYGESADKIYIIKRGEIKMTRRLVRQESNTSRGKLNEKVFGVKEFK